MKEIIQTSGELLSVEKPKLFGFDSHKRAIMRVFLAMEAGSFYRLQWERVAKIRKTSELNGRITKFVDSVVRSGVDYDRMQSTKQGRADGSKPAENAGLPYGQWRQFPRVIAHKGNAHLRFAFAPNHTPKVKFFLDGNEISKDQIMDDLLASEKQSRDDLTVFNCGLENIVKLERMVS
jgi:hypothetical protein